MVTISEEPTSGDFLIEIKGYKECGHFGTDTNGFCISDNCYRKFITNIHAKVSSADGSIIGPLGIVLCSI